MRWPRPSTRPPGSSTPTTTRSCWPTPGPCWAARRAGACDYLDADLHDPAALLAGAARTLDFTRPAAILLLAVLHFLPDADDPARPASSPRWRPG